MKVRITKKGIAAGALFALALSLVMTVPASALGGTALVIHGSTTVGPIIVDAATDFNGRTGATSTIDTVNLVQNGSSNGINDLRINLNADMAMSSRPLKTAEKNGTDGHMAVDSYPIARDGLEVIVNNNVPSTVTSLTMLQIRGIYEGIYTKWNNPAVTVAVPTTTATATCTLSGTGVGSVTMTSGGAGYTGAFPAVKFGDPPTGQTGGVNNTPAKGTVQVNSSGVVTGVTVISAGLGYTSAPGVTIVAPDAGMVFPQLGDGSGTGNSIDVYSRIIGSGTRAFFVSADSIPTSGSGASGTVTSVSGSGAVTGISIPTGTQGAGYNTATVSIGGSGSGFSGVVNVDGKGHIVSVGILNGGSGYSAAATVGFGGNNALGNNFYKSTSLQDGSPVDPLEEAVSGPTDGVAGSSGNRRIDANVDVQTAVNNSVKASIGYVGMGFGPDATHTNIRSIPVVSYVDGQNYYATPINVYSYRYVLSRYLYLVTPHTNPNPHNTDLITWMRTLDGKGQTHVTNVGFLKLVANEDVLNTGVIDVSQIQEVGNFYGQTHPADIRADVLRIGIVDVSAIQEVGAWYGTTIADYPHP